MSDVVILTHSLQGSLIQHKSLDGQAHIVIPAIVLQESVLNDVFYSSEEIVRHAQSWNGVPISVGHPKTQDGPTTANSPIMEETLNIGKFFNVRIDNGKLKGDIWINLDKATRLGFNEIADHFIGDEMMEVSTGLYADFKAQQGMYNEQPYKFVAYNIRPDHLALLPNDVGACSIQDGCGALRVMEHNCKNCQIQGVDNMKDKLVASLINNEFTQFCVSDRDVLMKLDDALLSKCTPLVNNHITDQDLQDYKDLKKYVEDIKTNAISEEDMAYFKKLKANEDVRLGKLREIIVNNYKHITSELAQSMSSEVLEALSSSIDFLSVNNAFRAGSSNSTVRDRPKYFIKANEVKNG